MKNKYFFPLLLLALTFTLNVFAQTAPNFTITTSGGQTKKLYEDYLDLNKTVVLKLFFTQCPPCQQIAPAVENLYQQWGGGNGEVEFISLAIYTNSGNTNAGVAAFKTQYGTTFPGAGYDGGSVAAAQPYTSSQFGTFEGTPTFVVIAPNKTVQFNPEGVTLAEKIVALDSAIVATGKFKTSPFKLRGSVKGNYGGCDFLTLFSDFGIHDTILGNFEFSPAANTPPGSYILSPKSWEESPVNGVSTFDLVLIQKHILGREILNNTFKEIAADANKSGTISTIDMVSIRKVILGVDSIFLGGRSFVFVPLRAPGYPMPPFQLPLTADVDSLDYVAVKIGDVSGSALCQGFRSNATEEHSVFTMQANDKLLRAGETTTINLQSQTDLATNGCQMSFKINEDLISVRDFSSQMLEGFSKDNWFQTKGNLNISWNNEKCDIVKNQNIFTVTVTAHKDLWLSDALQLDRTRINPEIYPQSNDFAEENYQVIDFSFKRNLPANDLQFYPNPVRENGSVLLVQLEEAAPMSVEIYNFLGQKVKTVFNGEGNKGTNQLIINLSDVSSGTYTIRVTTQKDNARSVKAVKL